MDAVKPKPEELVSTAVGTLGEARISSPLHQDRGFYTPEGAAVLAYTDAAVISRYCDAGQPPPVFEVAGPREKLFFDPTGITCGIVTCGGVCPGLNDAIRTVTLSLLWQYGVRKVWGFRYGYSGLSPNPEMPPIELTPDIVDEIQHDGGTILGSSRGAQDISTMVNTLVKYKVSVLFTIGGDGTFRGAHAIAQEIARRKLPIAIIGIPKTIDNDIYCCERTFGFSTAVEKAREAICVAHEEAKAAWNGVGLVKLMGRDSGFIAAYAALANSDVNYCLIPEAPFALDGPCGFLSSLERRLARKHHAVIVVSEGAGQSLIKEGGPAARDLSGNIRYKDIGIFLKEEIEAYCAQKNIPLTLKYIDPSYLIRSCPANADDSAFCLMLGQNAVHAAMAGKTDMFVGYWAGSFTNVPLLLATGKKKQLDVHGVLWQTLLETTGQACRRGHSK